MMIVLLYDDATRRFFLLFPNLPNFAHKQKQDTHERLAQFRQKNYKTRARRRVARQEYERRSFRSRSNSTTRRWRIVVVGGASSSKRRRDQTCKRDDDGAMIDDDDRPREKLSRVDESASLRRRLLSSSLCVQQHTRTRDS